MNKISILIFLFTSVYNHRVAYAQTGAGSMTMDNSTVIINAGSTEQRFSEGTYFGPQANWEINGTLEIYSKNIWIAPGASFKGTGKIVVYNPGSNPYYTTMANAATNIDGNNGNFINLIIEHRNPENIVLSNLTDPGYNTINPSGSAAAQLNIGSTLNLAVNQADIILNGNNLAFNSSGRIEGYSPNRMVVTSNSSNAHVIKDFVASTAFTFPVGIAEGDYTPAQILPTNAGKVFVSVQDFAAANKTIPDPQTGINRVWNIYGTPINNANLSLQHNTNINGSLFKDATAAIAKYQGSTNWEVLKGTNPALGVHDKSGVSLATDQLDNAAYYTKMVAGKTALFIPNLFTPNGDLANETFDIKGLENFAENDIVIINRWGNEVYKMKNYKNNWNGEKLNEGTYYYILRVKENTASNWEVFKGYVTLIREFKQ